jgi:hypothetical protein
MPTTKKQRTVHVVEIPDMPNWVATVVMDRSGEFPIISDLTIKAAPGEEITATALRKIRGDQLRRMCA